MTQGAPWQDLAPCYQHVTGLSWDGDRGKPPTTQNMHLLLPLQNELLQYSQLQMVLGGIFPSLLWLVIFQGPFGILALASDLMMPQPEIPWIIGCINRCKIPFRRCVRTVVVLLIKKIWSHYSHLFSRVLKKKHTSQVVSDFLSISTHDRNHRFTPLRLGPNLPGIPRSTPFGNT